VFENNIETTLKEEITAALEQLDKLKNDLDVQQKIKEKEITKALQELDELKTIVDTQENDLDILHDIVNSLQKETTIMLTNVLQNEMEKEIKEKELTKTLQELNELKNVVDTQEKDMDILHDMVNSLQKEITILLTNVLQKKMEKENLFKEFQQTHKCPTPSIFM